MSRETPFNVVSDVETTRRERLATMFDEYVRIPCSILRNDVRALIGGLGLLTFFLMGTVGVVLVSPPEAGEHGDLQAPLTSLQYPLGTDNVGRGLFELIVHATPPMLEMVIAGALFATTVATVVGTVAGYEGGLVDQVLSTLADIALTIPGLPLTILLALLLDPKQPYVIGLILTINMWGGLARSVRSQVLSVRQESYAEASQAMGLSTPRVILKDVLPNVMPYVFMNFMRMGRRVIFASVGLYFLGILPVTALNWGVILNEAWSANAILWPEMYHWLLVPMAVIIAFSYSLTLLAQSTDRIFNPRARVKHTEDN